MSVLEAEGFMDDVRHRAYKLIKTIDSLAEKYKGLFTRRGGGFLQGMVFKEEIPALDIVKALREHFVLSVPASENTVRLLPPLTITEEEIDHLASVLEKVFSQFEM